MILGHDDFTNAIVDKFSPEHGEDTARTLADIYMKSTFAKGLASTGILAQQNTTGGDALKLQDITKEIHVAELQSKYHAVAWNLFKKVPCFSDAVEKTTIDSWGGFRGGGFINYAIASAGLAGADPAITRSYLPVRWQGGRYQVFRTALAIRGQMINADPIAGAAENVSSTARLEQLILDTNYLWYHGNSDKNDLESQGAFQQVKAAHDGQRWVCRYNLNGRAVTPDVLPDIEEILRSKGGFWTDALWSPQNFADMRKEMINFIRTESGSPITSGTYMDEHLVMDLAGNKDIAKFHMDNFLNPLIPNEQAEGSNAPAAPTSVSVSTSSSQAQNVWGSYLPAGVYNYRVTAVGVNGRSAPVAALSTAAPNGGEKVVLTITNAAGNNVGDVSFFEIWRGDGATGKVGYLDRVKANSTAGSGTVTFEDNGERVAGTTENLIVSNRKIGVAGAEVITRQLFPFTKVKLPNDVMAEQSAWLGAMTPQFLTPHFCLVLENVGRR